MNIFCAMADCETLYYVGVFFALCVFYKLIDGLVRIPDVGRHSDRYILVTGCDSGFGQMIARRLDRLGCHVFAGCLTEVGRLEIQRNASERLHAIQLDVTDHNSILDAYEFVKSKLPNDQGLWGVLNNAGILVVGCPIEWCNLDTYKRMVAVNTFGTIDVTMTFLPLVKRSRGRVVNMSSVDGRFAIPGCTPYNVSKYGVEAFTDNLRRSLRAFGCKAALIEPAAYKTPLTSRENITKIIKDVWNSASDEAKAEYGEEYYKHVLNTYATIVNDGSSARMDDVLDAYEHALFGRFPRARYVVGAYAKWFFIPLQSLPEWFGDWILERLDSSTPKPAALKSS